MDLQLSGCHWLHRPDRRLPVLPLPKSEAAVGENRRHARFNKAAGMKSSVSPFIPNSHYLNRCRERNWTAYFIFDQLDNVTARPMAASPAIIKYIQVKPKRSTAAPARNPPTPLLNG